MADNYVNTEPAVEVVKPEHVHSFPIAIPEKYDWCPQFDITTYELAQAVTILMQAHMYGWDEKVEQRLHEMPDRVKRHFRPVDTSS